MSGQASLFDGAAFAAVAPPVARKRGPLAAQIAASEHTSSGRREANVRMILSLLRLRPGLTMRELHQALPAIKEGIEVSRRLYDLEKLGLVEKGPERLCTASSRVVTSYWPAGGQERGE
ncbi:MAG: hypothetical protein IPQ07_40075 [Myxococcales bacterium]|nr:hypothetical protein [Myxococcales bacterium]